MDARATALFETSQFLSCISFARLPTKVLQDHSNCCLALWMMQSSGRLTVAGKKRWPTHAMESSGHVDLAVFIEDVLLVL